ncbi:MAG: amidohydrolase [Planctomycetaceae bacterium]|nr:amidohydrolase [Planctomycetaceae bacterium]
MLKILADAGCRSVRALRTRRQSWLAGFANCDALRNLRCLAAALFVGASFVLRAAQPSAGAETAKWVDDNLPQLTELYVKLHQAPELSLQEVRTSELLAAELTALGAQVTRGLGGHGVVGTVENGPGKTVMVRADMDALPVVEATPVPYASKVKVKDGSGAEVGVMHACGHDIHMTCLVGTARYLIAHKDQWSGRLQILFQPAEERGAGAKAMLDDGLFKKLAKPDFALALHVDATLATGSVGCRAGYTLANVDSVDITVKGRGGHGAYPHTTVDPIVQAAQLILELQTIVSREISPTDPAVITVGAIRGGTKHNVIGDKCELQVTVRSFTDEVRSHLLAAIRRKALAVAAGARAPEPTIVVSEGTPAMYNDPALTGRLTPVLKKALGNEQVVDSEPSMGGEDFSEYGRAGVPIFMFRLGAVDGRRLARYREMKIEPPSLHSALFYPDPEGTISTGVIAMTASVLDLMAPDK